MTAIGFSRRVQAQQPVMPVVGFLSTRSRGKSTNHTNVFRRGLEEMGYVEGRSVAVEYRWADGDYGLLPPSSELLSQPLALMVAAGDPAAQAAKAAGSSVPLVFVAGHDPVRSGLVASMNRPGNATGINFFTGDLGGKRLELLCGMAPSANSVGLLLNPRSGSESADQHRRAVADAAQALGRELIVQQRQPMINRRRFCSLRESWHQCGSGAKTIRSSTADVVKSLRCLPITDYLVFSTSGSFRRTAG